MVSLQNAPNPSPLLTPTQRLIFGIFILLVVDVIWVASSELSKVESHSAMREYNVKLTQNH